MKKSKINFLIVSQILVLLYFCITILPAFFAFISLVFWIWFILQFVCLITTIFSIIFLIKLKKRLKEIE